MCQEEMDLLVAISIQFDDDPLTLLRLRNQLNRLEGSIRGGLESARRLRMLLDFLPENAALRRSFFESQRVIMAANLQDTGYRGQYVFMCQEEMDLLVSISILFDDDPLTLLRLRNQLNRLDGRIKGAYASNAAQALVTHTKPNSSRSWD